MRKCSYCGKEHPEGITICEVDGQPLVESSPELPVQGPPTVIGWVKVYSGLFGFMYIGVALFSLVFIIADPEEFETSRTAAVAMGSVLVLLGLVVSTACLLPLLLKPRPWLWTYDLVIICSGMTSGCFLPACIPLLISWIKPETKVYFGIQ